MTARDPHPDGATEIQLQRIISLRRAVLRKEDLLDRDQEQVTYLREKLRKHPNWNAAGYQRGQVERLQEEMTALEGEVTQLHDDIAAIAAKLSDIDLTYL